MNEYAQLKFKLLTCPLLQMEEEKRPSHEITGAEIRNSFREDLIEYINTL